MTRVPRQGTGGFEGPDNGQDASIEWSDAELVVRARGGDDASFVVLYERHFASARRLAGLYATSPADAEDLASEGFAQVLGAIRAGGGPQRAFRPYVLTVVRRLAASDMAREKRATPTPEVEVYAPLLPFEDPVLAELEASLVGRAFAALPERWQTVLWHTEVEGESPAQVAPLLGLSANAVAALACRAREGLRKEYLQAHLSEQEMARECRKCARKLAAYLRGSLGPRDRRRVEEHLDTCDRCPRLLLELRDVSSSLRAVLAPLLLGPAVATYFVSLVDASPDASAEGAEDGPGHEHADGPSDPDGQQPDSGHQVDDGGEGGLSGLGGAAGSSGAVVVTLGVVAGLTVLTLTAALTLSPETPSRPRTQGKAPAATPAPETRQPMPSGSATPPPTGPPSVSRPERPTPGPAAEPPGSPSGPPDSGATAPSSESPTAPTTPTPSSTPPKPPSGSVVADGNFESPVAGAPSVVYRAGDTIGPWQVVQNSVNVTRSDALQPAEGQQSIDLNGDPPGAINGAIAQTITTTAGRPYTVGFYLAGNVTCAPVVKTLRVQVGPVTRDFTFDTTGHSKTDMGWRVETVRFTAQSDRTTLRFTSTTDPGSRCGPEIDSVKAVEG